MLFLLCFVVDLFPFQTSKLINILQESLRIYKTGFVEESHPEGFASQRLVFRDGDIVSPLIKHAEPLQTQVLDFIQAIRTGSTPTSDCEIGRQVVRILEAGCESFEKGGAVDI